MYVKNRTWSYSRPTREEEIEELRRVRALRVDERSLVVERVRRAERAALVELEVPRARALHREPPHGHAVDLIESRGRSPPHVR